MELEEPPLPRPDQHHYNNYFEYCISLVGLTVGFGSFWRFPYLLYKNGGGAFLIPYILSMLFLGIPLFYMETLVGQMKQKSLPYIFSSIHKAYKMLGVAIVLVGFHIGSYYNIIITYSYRFLFSAFYNPLPYAH